MNVHVWRGQWTLARVKSGPCLTPTLIGDWGVNQYISFFPSHWNLEECEMLKWGYIDFVEVA